MKRLVATCSVALAAALSVYGCSSSSSETTPGAAADPDPHPPAIQNDGGSEGGDSAGCTPSAVIDRARTALAGGATSVPLDCGGTSTYSRTKDADGTVLIETIVGATGGKSVWDNTQATLHTYRFYPGTSGVTSATPSALLDATADPDAKTVTMVSTFDTTGDDVPDTRVTTVIDEALTDMTVQTETDLQQTGAWTVTSNDVQPLLQPAVAVDVPTSGANGCTQSQADSLRSAFEHALDQGLDCLHGLDPRTEQAFAETLLRSNDSVTVDCAADTTGTKCAEADFGGVFGILFPKLFKASHITIHTYPVINDPARCPAGAPSLIFHELGHFALGLHTHGGGVGDIADRVYGCQQTCFPANNTGSNDPTNKPASSLTCAACIGASDGDARCKKYPTELCPYDPPAFCGCTDKWYPTELTCATDCPSGLGCYGNECVVLGTGPCAQKPQK